MYQYLWVICPYVLSAYCGKYYSIYAMRRKEKEKTR